MKPVLTILIAEPNLYFSLGFTHGLLAHFAQMGIAVHLSDNLADKNHAGMVFLSAEQDAARVRYLTQRKTAPADQRIFVFKEKPSQYDKVQFKELDGIFYRHQSLSWAMQIATQALKYLPIRHCFDPHRDPLTDREREILNYLACGERPTDISRYLHISPKTVSGHKRNAMSKLGINRTSDLNYWLIRDGMSLLAPVWRQIKTPMKNSRSISIHAGSKAAATSLSAN